MPMLFAIPVDLLPRLALWKPADPRPAQGTGRSGVLRTKSSRSTLWALVVAMLVCVELLDRQLGLALCCVVGAVWMLWAVVEQAKACRPVWGRGAVVGVVLGAALVVALVAWHGIGVEGFEAFYPVPPSWEVWTGPVEGWRAALLGLASIWGLAVVVGGGLVLLVAGILRGVEEAGQHHPMTCGRRVPVARDRGVAFTAM